MLKSLVARSGCIAFFGPDLGNFECQSKKSRFVNFVLGQDTSFVEAVTNVADEIFIRAELFRSLPELVAAYVDPYNKT